jgi:hypothetical protein
VRRPYLRIIIITSLSACFTVLAVDSFYFVMMQFILVLFDHLYIFLQISSIRFVTLLYVLCTAHNFFNLSYFVLSFCTVQGQEQHAESEREKESGSESRSMDSLRFLLSNPMHACLAVQEANRLMTSK